MQDQTRQVNIGAPWYRHNFIDKQCYSNNLAMVLVLTANIKQESIIKDVTDNILKRFPKIKSNQFVIPYQIAYYSNIQ